ncbi:DUF4199 domain-containing protein [Fulvivirga lutimaris]|uniref:DUF4199 domain-containing protein n=1 Tax=Fulvivirga lutimaris TaxID=1819566 RepID=UPI0012BCD6E6|nr:DUF4199 domain-containing protein [Fulvivirga lutimaris]MTI39338.1 DUF4199 domain-containing protein [Fulvivirga lutimaris]
MKNIIVKNGLIAVAVIMGIQIVAYVIFGLPEGIDFDRDELLGYGGILLCLVFVFLGIREYHIKHGKSSFMKYLGIGSAISTFPSIAFGIYSVIYYKWLYPDFLDNYGAYQLEKMKASMSAQEFEVIQTQFQEDMAMWDSVGMQFTIMFITVFVIGLIISILSASYFQFKTSKS